MSESLKLLVDAEDQSSSAKGNMSAGCNDDAVAPVSEEEEMTSVSEHVPAAARRGRPGVDEGMLQADDLNVQIRAGKSEVRL